MLRDKITVILPLAAIFTARTNEQIQSEGFVFYSAIHSSSYDYGIMLIATGDCYITKHTGFFFNVNPIDSIQC